MKNKKYIIYNLILLAVLSIIIAILIIRLDKTNNSNLYIAQEKITDECVEEQIDYELNNSNEIPTSSAELKLSPNASLVIVKNYDTCGHTTKEYAEILPEMVNRNQEEIEQMYPNFIVQSFDKNELVVEKNESGFCGEHYILRDDNGTVIVNSVDENNKETLYERTAISTKYLTQTDIINLKDGIKVYGKENLNSLIEDYE